MKKIMFLHGFFASGQCQPALALREAFEGKAEVVSPDLPTHPKEALALIRDVINRERPDVLVGNSCGSFYAQMVAPVVGIPALLGNPHFRMMEFLSARIGRHKYKSKRLDGRQEFVIDESLIAEFAEMEAHQFDCCNPYYKEPTEKVHNVKWINNWTLLTGLLRNVKLLNIINAKYLRISLIFSTLAENFCYVRKLSTNPIK